MYLKQILLLLLMVYCHHGIAQNFPIDKKIKTIDSLIEYRQFEDANQSISELQMFLNKEYGRKEYIEQRIKLKFLQGKILGDQFEYSKALPLLLEALEEANDNKLHKLRCEIMLRIASSQEEGRNYNIGLEYLRDAQELAVKYKFEDLYSKIFLRYASLYRFVSDTTIDLRENQRALLIENGLVMSFDSAAYYANKAIEYARKYNNEADINEGTYSLGIISRTDLEKIPYFISSIPYLKRTNHDDAVGVMYTNIADIYREQNQYDKALTYSDSSLLYYDKMALYYKYAVPESRYQIFEDLGNVDSAYHYFKMTAYDAIDYLEKED